MELGASRVPFYVGQGSDINGGLWARNVTGNLASVTFIPRQPVSTLAVKFPAAFVHSSDSVSEINVLCDVHADEFGLHYWVYREDSAVGKKGDLMEIEYEPSDRTKRETEGKF